MEAMSLDLLLNFFTSAWPGVYLHLWVVLLYTVFATCFWHVVSLHHMMLACSSVTSLLQPPCFTLPSLPLLEFPVLSHGRSPYTRYLVPITLPLINFLKTWSSLLFCTCATYCNLLNFISDVTTGSSTFLRSFLLKTLVLFITFFMSLHLTLWWPMPGAAQLAKWVNAQNSVLLIVSLIIEINKCILSLFARECMFFKVNLLYHETCFTLFLMSGVTYMFTIREQIFSQTTYKYCALHT